ncbi:hypothetical protein PENFLA_c022G10726 [Penicillium flavigenum]|uniref:Uncharacterized protein n=1 Tax=Penicillium flavigenum TaxID=254877 RepID=A0A1V6SWS8_9EURO|nr:hypothetical protein PENFLA_c022G10726 [Penicillium flavigenum]
MSYMISPASVKKRRGARQPSNKFFDERPRFIPQSFAPRSILQSLEMHGIEVFMHGYRSGNYNGFRVAKIEAEMEEGEKFHWWDAYLESLELGCLEDRVEHVWAQILSFFWPVSANYGVEREAYVSTTSQSKANVVLTNFQNGRFNWESRDPNRMAYCIASIGEYVRFYKIEAFSTKLEYKASTSHDQLCSVKRNVAHVHDILTDIRADLARE